MTTKLSPVANASSTVDCSAFALCNLLLLMPHLPLSASAEIDYAAADPAALAQLADAADASLLIIHLGTTAIGRILDGTTKESFSEEESADAIEALGWLVAELGDLARIAQRMSAGCRGNTYNYAPTVASSLTLAKP